MVKRINLSMADELFSVLEEKRKVKGYMTTQEFINDILRQNLFAVVVPKKKSRAGRPPKVDDPLIAAFARKR